jgi:hypothetical protein
MPNRNTTVSRIDLQVRVLLARSSSALQRSSHCIQSLTHTARGPIEDDNTLPALVQLCFLLRFNRIEPSLQVLSVLLDRLDSLPPVYRGDITKHLAAVARWVHVGCTSIHTLTPTVVVDTKTGCTLAIAAAAKIWALCARILAIFFDPVSSSSLDLNRIWDAVHGGITLLELQSYEDALVCAVLVSFFAALARRPRIREALLNMYTYGEVNNVAIMGPVLAHFLAGFFADKPTQAQKEIPKIMLVHRELVSSAFRHLELGCEDSPDWIAYPTT